MDLKSLLITIVCVLPGIIIGFILGYFYDSGEIEYDVFEDYYGRRE